MASARAGIARLRKRDGKECHYCGELTTHGTATRDHVFPRSLGGLNVLENYVLACADCNTSRGNNLFYCECRRCMEIIFDGLYDPTLIKAAFDKIMAVNKPVVRRRRSKGKYVWDAQAGPASRTFPSFKAAIDFLSENNYALIQEQS